MGATLLPLRVNHAHVDILFSSLVVRLGRHICLWMDYLRLLNRHCCELALVSSRKLFHALLFFSLAFFK